MWLTIYIWKEPGTQIKKIYKCESSSPVSVVRIYTSALFLYWWKVSIINLRPPRAICRKNQIFVYILFLLRKWNVISLEVAHMTHLNLVHMLHEGYHHTWHHAALTSTISKNLKKKEIILRRHREGCFYVSQFNHIFTAKWREPSCFELQNTQSSTYIVTTLKGGTYIYIV